MVRYLLAVLTLLTASTALGDHPAVRFGHPPQGDYLEREGYVMGYDGWYKSARWTLHVLDVEAEGAERTNEFRIDPKVEREFRSTESDYVGAETLDGDSIDRGHLVPSKDMTGSLTSNSDTFYLSNMSPQSASFNRGIWKRLENLTREVASQPEVRECYVMSGPAVLVREGEDQATLRFIGHSRVPVPTHYWKSVLIVGKSGRLKIWSVLAENRRYSSDTDLESLAVTADYLEGVTGLDLWSGLATDVQAEMESLLEDWRL